MKEARNNRRITRKRCKRCAGRSVNDYCITNEGCF